jgi:hypothetical protein
MSKCQNNCNCENKGNCDDCKGNCECVVNNYVTLDLPSYPVLTGTITPDESLAEYLESPLFEYRNGDVTTYQLPTDMLVYPHSNVEKYGICVDSNAVIKTENIFVDGKVIIDHPEYYGGEDNMYEAIKIIEHYDLDFHLGNVLKYILRAGVKNKDTLLEDYKKALWYLQRKIDQIEKKG